MEDGFKIPVWMLGGSGAFALLIGLDLFTDYRNGSSGGHLLLEGLLLTASAAYFALGTKQLFDARHRIRTLQSDLETLNREKHAWQEQSRQMLAGLSVKIEGQFAKWKLTRAETEVGFLLLKGFSLKEIAELRRTKVKTVQQQSQAIYQKTGLANRSELAAFFLEDLLPPVANEAQ